TVEGGAAVLHPPLDCATAARAGAHTPRTIVDRKAVLEIAERAVRLAMVAQRRTPSRDRLGNHGVDRRCEPVGRHTVLPRVFGERACRAKWRQTRTMQRLADINVAETSNHTLIEQCGLERRHLAGEQGSEDWAIEGITRGIDPEMGEERMAVECIARHQRHEPEAPRVIVNNIAPHRSGRVAELKYHVVVTRVLGPDRKSVV